MRIFLVGFMGSGKSTFGKKLANKLNYKFIDLDDFIEDKYKLSIGDIFKQNGEDYFRQIENENLLNIIEQNNSNIVISAGGGTPCFYNNMDIMNESGLTIYIRQGANCLYHRLNRSKKFRPLIEGMQHFQLVEYLEKNLAIRKPFYEKAKYNILGKNLRTQQLISIVNKELKNRFK